MELSSHADNLAKGAPQQKMAIAFQTVAMVSMAIMGVTAAAHLTRDLLRSHSSSKSR
jgi:hypothetical protein